MEYTFSLSPSPSTNKKGEKATIYRPLIQVILKNPVNNKTKLILGLVDSGSDFCLFPAWIAEILGHNLKNGKNRKVRGICGETVAFLHTTYIEIPEMNYACRCDCWFSESFGKVQKSTVPSYGLLGLQEFFENFQVNINYKIKTLSLKPFKI